MSHPLRVRGLKHKQLYITLGYYGVASFTGAWIETNQRCKALDVRKSSHPLRVRGLKHVIKKSL